MTCLALITGAEWKPVFTRPRGGFCGIEAHDPATRARRRYRARPSPRNAGRSCPRSLQLAGEDQPMIQLTVEEEASFEESLEQAERGEFATDEQVRAIWAKHGL